MRISETDSDAVYNARDAVARFRKIGAEVPGPLQELADMELDGDAIWSREPNCRHKVIARWSGIECTVCGGTFCY